MHVHRAHDPRPLWTLKQCASYLSRSRNSLWKALKIPFNEKGSIPHLRISEHCPRFEPEVIQAWVRAGCPPAELIMPSAEGTTPICSKQYRSAQDTICVLNPGHDGVDSEHQRLCKRTDAEEVKMREYRVHYKSGSAERLSARDIGDARRKASRLLNEKIESIEVVEDFEDEQEEEDEDEDDE